MIFTPAGQPGASVEPSPFSSMKDVGDRSVADAEKLWELHSRCFQTSLAMIRTTWVLLKAKRFAIHWGE